MIAGREWRGNALWRNRNQSDHEAGEHLVRLDKPFWASVLVIGIRQGTWRESFKGEKKAFFLLNFSVVLTVIPIVGARRAVFALPSDCVRRAGAQFFLFTASAFGLTDVQTDTPYSKMLKW